MMHIENDIVEVMDRDGNLVNLPYNLTLPFARLLARSNITHLKRYAIDRVFRCTSNGQPIQPLECDFDFVDRFLFNPFYSFQNKQRIKTL